MRTAKVTQPNLVYNQVMGVTAGWQQSTQHFSLDAEQGHVCTAHEPQLIPGMCSKLRWGVNGGGACVAHTVIT